MSKDGVTWVRGAGGVAGARGEARSADVGRVLEPNKDSWWWHDTCHMHVADVQVGLGLWAGRLWLGFKTETGRMANSRLGMGCAGQGREEHVNIRQGRELRVKPEPSSLAPAPPSSQIMSNGMVGGGAGVYWMFYSGGSFEEAEVPPALQVRGSGCSTCAVGRASGMLEWRVRASTASSDGRQAAGGLQAMGGMLLPKAPEPRQGRLPAGRLLHRAPVRTRAPQPQQQPLGPAWRGCGCGRGWP